jgi:hypothetical protein
MREGKPRKITLSYPKHVFEPEKWLRFIELEGFADDWRGLRLTDEDLFSLQLLVMISPQGHPVIPGTDGLRKLRFAPERWAKGKRGAARVCYVYFPGHGIVLLVTAYAKNERDDISAAGKKAVKKLINEIAGELKKGRQRDRE